MDDDYESTVPLWAVLLMTHVISYDSSIGLWWAYVIHRYLFIPNVTQLDLSENDR